MSSRLIVTATSLLALVLASPACTGRIPKSGPKRESGQSGLMNDTFAAKNACNPENHLRPFIIEWDATDRSSFESYAANDVVVVRYEGCTMTVLEECRNDSVRGEQGAYKPVEWTSGALEKINISNEGELVAKLPLSVGTLGGRVAGGERFSMEYYVAGTRNATRSAVYREDLASNPGCEGATHFVYGYNLGAFALGSVTQFVAEAGVSLYGFGAGGKNERKSSADKQGGDLGTCKSDSAKEVEGCKSPIRLTLRPIREGANPEKEAMKAPDTDASLSAVGTLNAKLEMSEEANAHMQSAQQKLTAKDGKGCLAELDMYDKLNPKEKSTDPKSAASQFRAMCLMVSGKCDAGKVLARKMMENFARAPLNSPEQIDKGVEGLVWQHCQGKMSPRDELLKAYMAINMATSGASKLTAKECEDNYALIRKHKDVKPNDDEDYQIINAHKDHYAWVPGCFSRAGDCDRAWVIFKETFMTGRLAEMKDKAQAESIARQSFESFMGNKKCAEKISAK